MWGIPSAFLFWCLGLWISLFAAVWLYLSGKGQRYYRWWCFYGACQDGKYFLVMGMYTGGWWYLVMGVILLSLFAVVLFAYPVYFLSLFFFPWPCLLLWWQGFAISLITQYMLHRRGILTPMGYVTYLLTWSMHDGIVGSSEFKTGSYSPWWRARSSG